MERIDDWKDGLGAMVFIFSLPVFAFIWVFLAVLKDYIVEFIKEKIK